MILIRIYIPSPTNFRQAHLTFTQLLFDISIYDQVSLNSMRVYQSKLETYQLIQESSVQFVKHFMLLQKTNITNGCSKTIATI